MSDAPEQPDQKPQAQNGAEQQPRMSQRVLGQFVRDLSFENVMSQKGVNGEVQPEMQIRVNLDARKRADDQYEVVHKLEVQSKNKGNGDILFQVDLEYVGIFEIKGLPEDQLHPFLMIECPRIMFPFIRRIVSDVTRDGGFPPFNMDQIDYVALYRAEITRRAQQQQQAAGATDDDTPLT